MNGVFPILLAALALAPPPAASPPPHVGYDQRIGQQLPMGIVFTDEAGRSRTFGSCFEGKPVVLIFDYLRCPELCSLVAQGAVDSLRQIRPSIGRDFEVISVSVDPTDTPEMAKAQQEERIRGYGRRGADGGWHTLVGGAGAIEALTRAAGFRYAYDPRSRQYAHPSGLVVVTPAGVVSSYFLGVDFPAGQLVSAIERAAEFGTGSSTFSLLLVCFQGGSPVGRYGHVIWVALWVSVIATVAAVAGGIAWMLREERRMAPREGGPA